jgi:hypothetical protein
VQAAPVKKRATGSGRAAGANIVPKRAQVSRRPDG